MAMCAAPVAFAAVVAGRQAREGGGEGEGEGRGWSEEGGER